MKILIFKLIILLLSILSISLAGQEYKIHGKIKHIYTYRPISYANIYIKESKIGTISDEDGNFILSIKNPQTDMVIIFNHVAFDTLAISLEKVKSQKIFYLQPKIFSGNIITVEADRSIPEVKVDLPQSIKVIDSRTFESRGFVDVGDLLRTEQSIEVNEDLSGKKTLSIRAGNPEDVVVLYNGIKMNNSYDNIFDISLVNLEDIKQIEIIKGSNTALYGSEAFSGVINIVPKMRKNYIARFVQKFGSYDSGNWDLQLGYTFFNRLNISASYQAGGSHRPYSDSPTGNEFLENQTTHQSGFILYEFENEQSGSSEKNISFMYSKSTLDYHNNRFIEDINDINQLVSLKYNGNIFILDNLTIIVSNQKLDNRHKLPVSGGLLDRHFLNDIWHFNLQKRISLKQLEFLIAYQIEEGRLNFQDKRAYIDLIPSGVESSIFTRNKDGIVSIIKFHSPTGSNFLQTADIDISYRYDVVKDQQSDVVLRDNYYELQFFPGLFKENSWRESTLKLSSHLTGNTKNFGYNIYLTVGSNVKFPTLFQQISTPSSLDPNFVEITSSLNPEKNRSSEVGVELIKETSHNTAIDGWKLDLNYFKNYYENKFRMYYTPGIPVAFYDNVPNANISGFEAKFGSYLFKNQLNIELGFSKYYISEKAAFPFKSDFKSVINLSYDYAGYSFQVNGFSESEQVGWFRTINNELIEVKMPGYANLDIHLSKYIDFYKFKLILNISFRNIFGSDITFEGIGLRDRRIYLSFGIEY